ncbi:helix-turn-helix domain-containing protein [Pusillimonas sp. ANT_WB101]|uniref:AraC family transcriptional regulator n=1 Tax=Pusillimonas sp. ANT_WB101 TaxID=2597356 RepID=UPI00165E7ABE|nr:helix-turn-helix transcriptional regulator [Pusillimonas sp. ANT_WB101]
MPHTIDLLEQADRDVVVVESSYPDGHVVATHTHKRVQLLHAISGIMRLETDAGTWIVPPGFALWIPAGIRHQLRTTRVTTRSLYFRLNALRNAPQACQVIEVSPLLRALIDAAAQVPVLYDTRQRDGMLMRLLLLEACQSPAAPFHLPMPHDSQLAALCNAFFAAPMQTVTPSQWAQVLHVSERTFYRRFLAGTGLSFMEWRRKACVFVAISRLTLGDSVTRIALDMGYESSSAFSAMFRKETGKPPSAYARHAVQDRLSLPA